jgi:hypothetical protein
MTNNNSVLFVTAFKDIGRGSWGNYFQRSQSKYIENFDNLAKLPIRLICFCEKDVEAILHQQCRFYNTHPYEPHGTFLQYMDKERELMDSPAFKDLVRNRIDPETNKPGYNLVNHNKFWFIKKAKIMFPNYTHYAWLDFGLIQDKAGIPQQFDFSRLKDKIVYGIPEVFPIDSIPTPLQACSNAASSPMLFGGEFFCPAESVDWFFETYHQMVQKYYSMGLVDDDQEMIKQIIKSEPERFDLVVTHDWSRLLRSFAVP